MLYSLDLNSELNALTFCFNEIRFNIPVLTNFFDFFLCYLAENLIQMHCLVSKLTNNINVKHSWLTAWRNKALYLQAVNCSATWNKRHDGQDLYHLIRNQTDATTPKKYEAYDVFLSKRNSAPWKRVMTVFVQALLELYDCTERWKECSTLMISRLIKRGGNRIEAISAAVSQCNLSRKQSFQKVRQLDG